MHRHEEHRTEVQSVIGFPTFPTLEKPRNCKDLRVVFSGISDYNVGKLICSRFRAMEACGGNVSAPPVELSL